MTRTELESLRAELNTEYNERHNLGGYSTDANGLLLLTRACLLITLHLINLDKEMTKLKRTLLRAVK